MPVVHRAQIKVGISFPSEERTKLASMTGKTSPREILERAEKLLGRKQIADGLKVSEDMVKSWCEGTGTLSDSHLLRLADLLAQYAARRK
jgi:hypothetical protein